MKTKYFLLTWLLLNLIFLFTCYLTMSILVGEWDANLWLHEAKHFYAYVCFIFSLISLQLSFRIVNKF